MTDVLDFIDWSCVECLNQNPSHSLNNALKQVIQCFMQFVYIILCLPVNPVV